MEYEELVQMIGHIKAATDIAFSRESELPPGVLDELTDIQNRINNQRLAMLGNGLNRPYAVADLNLN